MKIAFFSGEKWEQEYFSGLLKEKNVQADLIFHDKFLSEDNLPDDRTFEIACVFVDSVISAEVISRLPNLKIIVTRSTGYDHIDLKTCQERGIAVAFVPAYGEHTVAEYAFALILSLSRKIYESFDRIKETGSFDLKGLRGFDLNGKILGVVGTGRIGKNVVKIANGFGMKVLAYDLMPDKEFEKDNNFSYVSLEELLNQSDIVTLHVPYMKETHHLLNDETIKLMKPGSYLINTSRGAVVETEALVKALRRGQVAGAGLDVLEEEGAVKDEMTFLTIGHPEESNLRTVFANHILIDTPNVIITPHNAFNTQQALERILQTTLENITSFIEGSPKNLIG